jgi:hypothetical protein
LTSPSGLRLSAACGAASVFGLVTTLEINEAPVGALQGMCGNFNLSPLDDVDTEQPFYPSWVSRWAVSAPQSLLTCGRDRGKLGEAPADLLEALMEADVGGQITARRAALSFIGAGARARTGARTNANAGATTGANAGDNANAGADAGDNANAGADAGANAGDNANAGTGTGTGAGSARDAAHELTYRLGTPATTCTVNHATGCCVAHLESAAVMCGSLRGQPAFRSCAIDCCVSLALCPKWVAFAQIADETEREAVMGAVRDEQLGRGRECAQELAEGRPVTERCRPNAV